MTTPKKMKPRCPWAASNKIFFEYHDKEWCVPIHDDRLLFEMLTLEGAQAGLSWLTILKKRENYQKAFDHFDVKKIVKYTPTKKASLLKNEGIVRNLLKINSVIENAKAYITVQKEFGSFDKFIWGFTSGKTLRLPGKNGIDLSQTMSKELKKRGFKFVGPTICYAFMQAVGIVDDHSKDCFKYKKS
jgi:DNA-3-methyladenine glycosylase I